MIPNSSSSSSSHNQEHHQHQHEESSVISATSSILSQSGAAAQQTRFSFYNAQDFVAEEQEQQSPPQQQQPTGAGAAASEAAENSTKNAAAAASAAAAANANLSNNSIITTIPPPTLSASSQNYEGNLTISAVTARAPMSPQNNNSNTHQYPDEQQQQHLHHRDSAEILKSLQEHEQQRLEILAGPATSTRSQKQQQQQQQHGPMTTYSNPYEDAIKEALDLLRKHRTNSTATGSNNASIILNATNLSPPALSPRSPAPGMLSSFNATTAPTTPMGTFLQTAAAAATTSTATTPLSRLQHSTFQQQYQGGGGSDPGSGAGGGDGGAAFYYDSSGGDGNNQIDNDDDFSPNNNNNTSRSNSNSNTPNNHLGETYQAEIEARRKQRQERMARYASRLAELKQESDQKAAAAAASSTNSDVGASTTSTTNFAAAAVAAAMGVMSSSSSNGVAGIVRGRSSSGNSRSNRNNKNVRLQQATAPPPRVDTSMTATAWEDATGNTVPNMDMAAAVAAASDPYYEQDFLFPHSSRSAPSVMDTATTTAMMSNNMSLVLPLAAAAAAAATTTTSNIAECHVGSSTSTTGTSVSNRTGNNSTEEEVQRGVERVLLAILERAHSQGRAYGASESTSSNSALPQQNRQQPQRFDASEEKKCYDDAQQQQQQQAAVSAAAKLDEGNSLVRAMSDLLGMPSSTSTLGSWSPTRQALQHLEQDQQYQHQYHQQQQQQQPPDRRRNQHDATRPAPLRIVSSNASGGDTMVELSSTDGQLSIQENRRQLISRAIKQSNPAGAAIERATEGSISDVLAPPVDARDGATSSEGGARVQNQRNPDAASVDESDALDEMVRQVLKREEAGNDDEEIQADSNEHDDSLDRRVRSVVSQEEGNRQDEDEEASDSASTIDDDIATRSSSEDETIRSSNSDADEDDDLDESSARIDNVSYDNDDDHSEDDDDDEHRVELDGVLGPLSEKAGGTTGIVLEPDSPPSQSRGVASPSILDSLSAAMSLVTGNSAQEGKCDKYASQEGDYEEDEEASELMRTLCAHLLPVGVTNQSNKLLDKLPEWDESNPDEAGYRIIRLTTRQLASVEHAFEGMVNSLKQNSERGLVGATGSDEAFERDLQAAEELLNREEMRKQEADKTLAQDSDGTTYSLPPAKEQFDGPGSGIVFARELKESDLLPEFPGVKPTGRGEMGDLEFFHLPIIFKSHVTGFEPTKDLFLEAGNIVAGQYLVAGELGSAAFSTAYRCVDLNSEGDGPDGHDEVCLKVIKNTKDFFDQSLDEIKILELLRQTGRCPVKNIVEMKTFFYHREHLVIVTELLRQNLFEFGKFILDNDEEPYFTMLRLSFITRQVLIALEFVHKLGLVHCDVKPENILLSSYSRAQVKLIDFGSSCFITDRQSSYIQSRSYRAPEVVLGLPYDGRIDIWSLGCVVAEMFTGEVTFQNDSIVSMLSRIEAICGPFPRHMIAQGRQSGRFFAKCGLLYEKVAVDEKEDDAGESQTSDEEEENSERSPRFVDVFQPKVTSLSSRLGFAQDLMEKYDNGKKLTKDENRHAIFVDFVRKLLTIDPEARPTATEALDHPWTRLAASLTEEDIKYPTSSPST